MKDIKEQAVVIALSLVLTIATTAIPKKVDNVDQLRSMHFGYPISFVEQFISYDPPVESFPRSYSIQSIREQPTMILLPNFVASWLIVLIVGELALYVFNKRNKSKGATL